jgi:hypothetical protein
MSKFDPKAPFKTIMGGGKPKFEQNGVLYNKAGDVVTEEQLASEVHQPRVAKPGSLQMKAAIPINQEAIQDAIDKGVEDALKVFDDAMVEQKELADKKIAEMINAAEEEAADIVKAAKKKADKKPGSKKSTKKEDPLAD